MNNRGRCSPSPTAFCGCRGMCIATRWCASCRSSRCAARRSGSVFTPRLIAVLTSMGVTVLMTAELEDRYTDLRFSAYGNAFLTDSILMLRYVELAGRFRRVVSVVKVRASQHSKEIRFFDIETDSILIGEALRACSTITCTVDSLDLGALRRCESLVWLATRRAPRLASHPNPAANCTSYFVTGPKRLPRRSFRPSPAVRARRSGLSQRPRGP